MNLYLGIDDTDGNSGGCTTYTLSTVIDELKKSDPDFCLLDFPKLIRFNPNIPFKTRGNGGLSIHFSTQTDMEELFQTIIDIVSHDSARIATGDSEPSVVLIEDENISHKRSFYEKALTEVLSPKIFTSILKNAKIWYKNETRGLVGATSAIIAELNEDYTFELLAYRKKENYGTKRVISVQNLIETVKKFKDTTFSSFDFVEGRELIAPSGPDPVFCGIRGEDPYTLIKFFHSLKIKEPLDSYTIFKTNQGTGDHLRKGRFTLKPYHVFSALVKLISPPMTIKGGHTKIIARSLYSSAIVHLMFFEPTKTLAKIAQHLMPGDICQISGGVKDTIFGKSIAVEEMIIVETSKQITNRPPLCPNCSKRMTSAGKFKGYKCKLCGTRNHHPEMVEKIRDDFPVKFRILPVPSAQRHLTKPYERMGRNYRFSFEKMDKNQIRVRFDDNSNLN